MQTSGKYIDYQTFDEFSMAGIDFSSNEKKHPYVSIKYTKDTIFIKYSTQKHTIPTTYIRKNNYWFNIWIEDYYCEPGFGCERSFTRCKEKYIYNDTVITYAYYKDFITNEELTLGRDISIETKENKISLTFGNTLYIDVNNKFESIKSIVDNYKSIFLYSTKEYSPRYYHFYDKVIKGDTLFIYENDGNKSWLSDVRKLNSLGEFDPVKGESIINEIPFH